MIARPAVATPSSTVTDALAVASDVVTVVLALAAALTAVAVWRGRDHLALWTLRRSRNRTVGDVLVRHGARPRAVRAAVRTLVSDRALHRRPAMPEDELAWLGSVLRDDGHAVGFHGGRPGRRVTLLTDLGTAYAELHAMHSGRVLLSTDQVLALDVDRDLCASMIAVLRSLRRFEPAGEADADGLVMRRVVDAADQWVEIAIPPAGSAGAWPERVHVSHRALRVLPDVPHATERAATDGVATELIGLSAPERTALDRTLDDRHFYDGILPSLRGARWERDRTSGLGRLHLELGECTYSAVVAATYGGRWGVGREATLSPVPGTEAPDPRLVTLTLLLVTDDGYLVTVRRAGEGVWGGHLFPAVNGNLEIGALPDGGADTDGTGALDPAAAIVREAAEELGLTIDPARVRCTGLARFARTGRESGSHVLCFVAPAGVDVEGLQDAHRRADPVAGGYEVGSDFVLLPSHATGLRDALTWAAHATDAGPHLVAALACMAMEQVEQHKVALPVTREPTSVLAEDSLPAGARVVRTRDPFAQSLLGEAAAPVVAARPST